VGRRRRRRDPRATSIAAVTAMIALVNTDAEREAWLDEASGLESRKFFAPRGACAGSARVVAVWAAC